MTLPAKKTKRSAPAARERATTQEETQENHPTTEATGLEPSFNNEDDESLAGTARGHEESSDDHIDESEEEEAPEPRRKPKISGKRAKLIAELKEIYEIKKESPKTYYWRIMPGETREERTQSWRLFREHVMKAANMNGPPQIMEHMQHILDLQKTESEYKLLPKRSPEWWPAMMAEDIMSLIAVVSGEFAEHRKPTDAMRAVERIETWANEQSNGFGGGSPWKPRYQKPPGAPGSVPVCFDFNRQGCGRYRCKFEHRCHTCGSPRHGAVACRARVGQA